MAKGDCYCCGQHKEGEYTTSDAGGKGAPRFVCVDCNCLPKKTVTVSETEVSRGEYGT